VKYLVVTLALSAAFADEAKTPQTPPKPAEHSLDKQSASIQKQWASVKRQYPEFFVSSALTGQGPAAAGQSEPPAYPIANCLPMNIPEIQSIIDESAAREKISGNLLKAVIQKESAFDTCAVSNKGAMGLMQLMPATAQQFQVSDPFNPKQNIEAGSRLLKQLLERYSGDLSLALSAYNAGAATVDKTGKIPDIAETKDYVSDIMSKLPQVP
jgi:soluble lytic murein transglycosylase-like protein